MTLKNMDARREAFEAWFESLNHYKPDKSIGTQSWWYSEPRVSDAWRVWQAALDSICVELPFETYGCMDADKVKEALATTGVPYK